MIKESRQSFDNEADQPLTNATIKEEQLQVPLPSRTSGTDQPQDQHNGRSNREASASSDPTEEDELSPALINPIIYDQDVPTRTMPSALPFEHGQESGEGDDVFEVSKSTSTQPLLPSTGEQTPPDSARKTSNNALGTVFVGPSAPELPSFPDES